MIAERKYNLSRPIAGPRHCERSQLLGVHCIAADYFRPVADYPAAAFGVASAIKSISVPVAEISGKRIAIVRLDGVLTKYGFLGDARGAMVVKADVIRSLGRDDSIDAIVLTIDSPGGTVAGTIDLADAVYAVRQVKPIVAYVEDLAASAAYWVASQATAIYANNAGAAIGSVGAYIVAIDMSRMFEARGIETVVIRSGPNKGIGVPGDKITDSQRQSVQSRVDSVARMFVSAIGRGRGLTAKAIEPMADGSIFPPMMAQTAGLIDGIADFETLLASVAKGME